LSETWELWQLDLLDDYILGYSTFSSQEEMAEEIGKSLNAVKIRLSRRKDEIEINKRKLTIEEYKLFLSNRFDKTTVEIASLINASPGYLLHELDEIDCLESCEYLLENFEIREFTEDELKIFLHLYRKRKRNKFQISHILNRPIYFIEELISKYEERIVI